MKLFSSKLERFSVHYPNQQEYRSLKHEIFTQDTYYFESENPQPKIIDAGAHIGMSTLYFKKLYPHAHIIAIEPNPESIYALETNIFINQLDDVTVTPKALSSHEGEEQFYTDATADHWDSTASFTKGAWTGDQDTDSVTVPTIRLSQFLDSSVDLLKLDIEGAEQEVLFESQHLLHNVSQLFVEFHPTPSQSLPKVLELLEDAGFTLTLLKKNRPVKLSHAHGLVMIEGIR